MSSTSRSQSQQKSASLASDLALYWSICRPQILAMVWGSSLTYASIYSNELHFVAPCVAVYDWFIVNFTNKVTDIDEDLRNGIPGANLVAKKKRSMEVLLVLMIIGGLLMGHFLFAFPIYFSVARVVFTLIGLGYNFKIVPVVNIFNVQPRRENTKRSEKQRKSSRTNDEPIFSLSRFKEMFFFKNCASAVLFVLSVFFYPLLHLGDAIVPPYPTEKLLYAIAFFFPLELTYEIIYDLRDVAGDREEGVPTYPVVLGVDTAKKIVYCLLALSASACMIGAQNGVLERKEWLVVAGVFQQLVAMQYYCGGDRLPTSSDTTMITWMGAVPLIGSNILMQNAAFRALILGQ